MGEASRRRMPVSFVQLLLVSGVLLAAILGVFLLLRDEQQRVAFSDVISPAVEFVSSAFLFAAAEKYAAWSKRLAVAWSIMALAMLLYAMGDVVWGILELVLKAPLFPSLADGFYLAYYPVFLAGVVLLINRPAKPGDRINTALDLVIMLAAAMLGFWYFLIGPTIQSNIRAPLLDQLILLAYPVGDLVLLAALLLLIYTSSDAVDMTTLALLAGGTLITIVSDSVYGYQSLLGTYVSGGVLDFGWMAANMTIGLAGASVAFARGSAGPAMHVGAVTGQTTRAPGGDRVKRSTRSWPEWVRTYLPYVGLMGILGLLVSNWLAPLPVSTLAIVLGVIALMGRVLVRQSITLSENSKLNLELNAQTARLETTNRDLQVEIAERQHTQERLAFDALHDDMTGLANRVLFLDRLGQALERSKRHREQSFAVLFIDLEQFKIVNDTLGHSSGDQVLVSIGQRLKETLRASDTVARFGGDEYAILVEDVGDEHAVRVLAEKIQKAVGLPLNLQGREVHIAASIGIVTDLLNYDSPEDLLRDADLAMYQAKAIGTAHSEFFRAELRDQAFARMEVEQDLRRGIENGEIRLHYQPITSLESGHLVGLEVLARWFHPVKGLLFPADFLPVAEESGLILPLGDWILHQACLQMKAWQDQHPHLQDVSINVNLSNKEFSQPNLVEKVAEALRDSGLKAASLRLEITERVLVGNFAVANNVVAALQHLGVQLQIDDFGTGYSALAYIQQFPINAIKIDRSFIQQMGTSPKGLGLVRAIVSMGRELAIETIAEGIETEEQLKELKGLSCGFGQGYLLSRPLDAATAEKMLAKSGVGPVRQIEPVGLGRPGS